MKFKVGLGLMLIIAFLSASFQTAARNDVASATNKTKLQALAKQLKERGDIDYQKVREAAKLMGIPVRQELPNGKVLEFQRISPATGPAFYITNNIDAADTVSTDEVWPGGSAGLNLEGSGMTVGEWDAGAVQADHWDLYPRVTQRDGVTTISDHSTHVAGTLIASGEVLDPRVKGMAYASQLDAWDWNFDSSEMAGAAAGGLLLSNHSYGIAAGWIYLGGAAPDEWWWIGGTGTEDPNFGYYDSQAQLWDQIAFDAPYYLIVKAAGNDRWDTGPAAGEEYTVIDQDGNALGTSTEQREPDCAPAGYDCLPTHSVAKNILTVGAVDDLVDGYLPLVGSSQVSMLPFSSWGPTDDGRIKPDVVGNGWLLLSTYPPNTYAAAIGTSMAAPNVTGSLLLLQEHYEDIHGAGNFMRSATLKALAIHTADEAGDADGPDYAFGWGLLNTKTAAKVISEDGVSNPNYRIIEGSLANGTTDTFQVDVSEDNSLITATLVWTDPPGTPAAPALDPSDLMLVNDLDLRITRGPSTYLPWVLDPANPAAAATNGDNFRDNVEQVEIASAGTGTYTLEVSHKSTLQNGPQNYSLIISVIPAPPTGSSLLIDEDFSGGLPAGWSVETASGVSWEVAAPVPGDPWLDNLTGGSGQFAMANASSFNLYTTSLVTHSLDLSAATGVALRFNSYFSFYLLESINVDVSTNGGTSWNNVWSFQGFAIPTIVSLDITGAAAGHADVKLRFRYDNSALSDYAYLWQIDNVQLEVYGIAPPPPADPPGPASNPTPTNGSNALTVDSNLAWTAGSQATSHNVYFGTDSTPDTSEYQGNQVGTSFDPGTLAYSTTYYWRVDEINENGTTTGTTWSFTTEAAPSANTAPTASFDYSCKKTVCTFSDASTDPDLGDAIQQWSWDFGDGSSSTEQNPTHTYPAIGVAYTVTLTVRDNSGSENSANAALTLSNKNKPVNGSSGSSGGGDSGTVAAEKGRNKCGDGIDNDGDGLIDGADPDCQ